MTDGDCLPQVAAPNRRVRPSWPVVVIVLALTMTFTIALLCMHITPPTVVWIDSTVAAVTVALIRRTGHGGHPQQPAYRRRRR